MSEKTRTLKAFTLLELIIGMAIVAILMGLGIAGINTLQQSTRNTERRTALEGLYTEIEAMRGDIAAYPAEVKVSTYGTSTTTIVLCQTAGTGTACGTGISRTVTLKGSAVIAQSSTKTASDSVESVYCYNRASASSFILGVSLEGGAAPFSYGSASACWNTSDYSIATGGTRID